MPVVNFPMVCNFSISSNCCCNMARPSLFSNGSKFLVKPSLLKCLVLLILLKIMRYLIISSESGNLMGAIVTSTQKKFPFLVVMHISPFQISPRKMTSKTFKKILLDCVFAPRVEICLPSNSSSR